MSIKGHCLISLLEALFKVGINSQPLIWNMWDQKSPGFTGFFSPCYVILRNTCAMLCNLPAGSEVASIIKCINISVEKHMNIHGKRYKQKLQRASCQLGSGFGVKFEPNLFKILVFRTLQDSGITEEELWTLFHSPIWLTWQFSTGVTERCQNQFNFWKLLWTRNVDGSIRTKYLSRRSHLPTYTETWMLNLCLYSYPRL